MTGGRIASAGTEGGPRHPFALASTGAARDASVTARAIGSRHMSSPPLPLLDGASLAASWLAAAAARWARFALRDESDGEGPPGGVAVDAAAAAA